jgi:hypothetical protein
MCLQVQAGGSPDESTVVFQYTVYDKRKPALDDNGNKMRKVRHILFILYCGTCRVHQSWSLVCWIPVL